VIADFLSNIFAKKYANLTMFSRVTAKNIGMFLRHSVECLFYFSSCASSLVFGHFGPDHVEVAITPFKVIQCHRLWYQSKAHMRLPISD